MGQMAKGLGNEQNTTPAHMPPAEDAEEELDTVDIGKELERVKWFLWHGSKRMVKKQQMRWSEAGAHNLLQVRTKVLNDQPRETFLRWYPGMQTEQETEIEKKAA